MMRTLFTCALAWLALSLVASPARANHPGTADDGSAGARVLSTRGEVARFDHALRQLSAAGRGTRLAPGDRLETGDHGRATLRLSDGSLVALNTNSRFEVERVAPATGRRDRGLIRAASIAAQESVYLLQQGEAWLLNKDPQANVRLRTPVGVLGIRGTEVNLRVAGDGTSEVTVLEGRITFGNDFGELEAGPGERVTTRPGAAPVTTLLLHPADAVQWTLVVPERLTAADLGADPAEIAVAERLLAAVGEGRFDAARQQLSDRHLSAVTRELLVAWSELHDGQPARAFSRLEATLARTPDSAAGWRLLALAALPLDRRERAGEAINRALELAPGSASGWLLKGYLAQADFELDAAAGHLRHALELDPGHVAALIALARLRFGQGETAAARQLAERALAQAPDNGDALNLLGFVLLGSGATEAAAERFDRAIDRDPWAAEPWLGRGLVRLRRGEVEPGLEALANAVLLDPRRAMLRTYWAKGLYEVGHHGKALDVLDVAREIDPRDPSPSFYQALVLRDLRRPDEAIAALHEAQRKNGRRGVYRSRFLLDADSAVRNVDLSLLYADLGLAAWSRRGAVEAVTDDYSNASAHLQYAGSLAAAADRSAARNTENLLARLLQPANINTFNTFNEYTALVERPGLGGSATVSYGEQGTAAGQLLAYGAAPRHGLAYGIGGVRQQTDGWRDSNYERFGDLVGYLKWDPAAGHGLMFAASASDSELGDKLLPRFSFSDPAEPEDRLDGRTRRVELGYHRRLAPGNDLLLHVAHLDSRLKLHDYSCQQAGCGAAGWLEQVTDTRVDEPYTLLQGSWMTRRGNQQWLAGAAWYDGRQQLDFDGELRSGPPPASTPLAPRATARERRSQSLWLHGIRQLDARLSAQFGLHFESMDNGSAALDSTTGIDAIHPRAGLAWRIDDDQTVRLAAFRSLLPFLSDRLDPADIAGLPVQRNGSPGSVTDELQLAWEHSWSRGFAALVVYAFERELRQRLAGGGTRRSAVDGHGVELTGEGLLGHGVGLAASYAWRVFDDDPQSDISRHDQQFAATLTWVDPRGFGARVGQVWRRVAFATARDDETLWSTDIELSYALRGKRGAVTLAVENLFDDRFDWFTDPFDTRGRIPARRAILQATVNF